MGSRRGKKRRGRGRRLCWELSNVSNRHQDSLVNMPPPHLVLSSCEIRGKNSQFNFSSSEFVKRKGTEGQSIHPRADSQRQPRNQPQVLGMISWTVGSLRSKPRTLFVEEFVHCSRTQMRDGAHDNLGRNWQYIYRQDRRKLERTLKGTHTHTHTHIKNTIKVGLQREFFIGR